MNRLLLPYASARLVLEENHQLIKVDIVGSSDYSGGELLRILLQHPSVRVKWVSSRGGKKLEHIPAGSNFCQIGMDVDHKRGRVVIFSALDNLVKGAAGAAVQNMHVMFGLPEETGLTMLGMHP